MGGTRHTHEEWQLIWSEDENEEELCDAIRRFTGFSLVIFKQAAERIAMGSSNFIYVCGEYKLRDFKDKASEIFRKTVK